MRLPRLQLIEFEDLPGCPSLLRAFAMDYLNFMESRLRLHRAIVPLLAEVFRRSGMRQAVDLCSGGGGPVAEVIQGLREQGLAIEFVLTDKFPGLKFGTRPHHGELYCQQSIDATAVPASLKGVRTMFNAFHHFPPKAARAVLEDAVRTRQPIAIFEISERSLAMFAAVFLTPLYVCAITPWLRPFSWLRLLLTYVAPAIPFLCWFDGMVSQCRAYTIDELVGLAEGLSDFEWKSARVRLDAPIGHLTYLIGVPR